MAVAETEGIDPLDLKKPLFESIDSEALDALSQNRSCRIHFKYHGHEITVTKAGDVVVD